MHQQVHHLQRLLRPLEVVEAAVERLALLARRVRLPLLERRLAVVAHGAGGGGERGGERAAEDERRLRRRQQRRQRRQHRGERDRLERPHAHRRPLVEVDDVRLPPQRLVEEEEPLPREQLRQRRAEQQRRAAQQRERRLIGCCELDGAADEQEVERQREVELVVVEEEAAGRAGNCDEERREGVLELQHRVAQRVICASSSVCSRT